jgi:hypothetical protein
MKSTGAKPLSECGLPLEMFQVHSSAHPEHPRLREYATLAICPETMASAFRKFPKVKV